MSTYLISTCTLYCCRSDCCVPANLLPGRRKEELYRGNVCNIEMSVCAPPEALYISRRTLNIAGSGWCAAGLDTVAGSGRAGIVSAAFSGIVSSSSSTTTNTSSSIMAEAGLGSCSRCVAKSSARYAGSDNETGAGISLMLSSSIVVSSRRSGGNTLSGSVYNASCASARDCDRSSSGGQSACI